MKFWNSFKQITLFEQFKCLMESGIRLNRPEYATKFKTLHQFALENQRISNLDLDSLPDIWCHSSFINTYFYLIFCIFSLFLFFHFKNKYFNLVKKNSCYFILFTHEYSYDINISIILKNIPLHNVFLTYENITHLQLLNLYELKWSRILKLIQDNQWVTHTPKSIHTRSLSRARAWFGYSSYLYNKYFIKSTKPKLGKPNYLSTKYWLSVWPYQRQKYRHPRLSRIHYTACSMID